MLSLHNILNATSPKGGKSFGEVWSPKAQRVMVGRDVGQMQVTSSPINKQQDMIFASGDETRIVSQSVFTAAKNVTQGGMRVRGFRGVDIADLENSSDAARASSALYESDTHIVTKVGNAVSVYSKAEEKVVAEANLSDDVRITWNDDGNPEILTGSEALTQGKLKAHGANEVLIRVSKANVEGGINSTVLNLSEKNGEFSGGVGVTYLGTYGSNHTLESGGGTTNFAGYFGGAAISTNQGEGLFSGVFEAMTIEGGNHGNSFTGYFANTTVNGGNGSNSFSGMFLSGNTLNGGDQADTFSGRFIDNVIDGGKGNDRFGNGGVQGAGNGTAKYRLHGDFISSSVTAGEGDKTFSGTSWDSSISFGNGENKVSGAFYGTNVTTGDGDDVITAVFSKQSTFTAGGGKDEITLATALENRVTTGAGTSKIEIGANEQDASPINKNETFDNSLGTMGTTWSTSLHEDQLYVESIFGQIEANTVYAEKGDNTVAVNNGETTQTVWTRNVPLPRTRTKKDGETQENEQETPAARKGFRRYANMIGSEATTRGALGVSVHAGDGQSFSMYSTDHGLTKFSTFSSGPHTYTMRATAYGRQGV